MRALIITTFAPRRRDLELSGPHLRLRLFVEGICEIADNIKMLHIVSEEYVRDFPDIGEINTRQSEYFGRLISTRLVTSRATRIETLRNHYFAGIMRASEQQDYYLSSGAEQATQVGRVLDEGHDLVFVHRLPAMLPVLRSGRRPSGMLFDLDDLMHRVKMQAALQSPASLGKLAYLFQIPAVLAAEVRGARRSRLTFVCSETDQRRLQRLACPRVAVVPNALPVPRADIDLPWAPTILFLGSCWYPPNRKGAERLVQNIFPRVRAAIPEAQLFIAGKGSAELASSQDRSDGVRYLGYVDDLPALYRSARVVCCPITSGSGTRVRLIEAAGYGRPMVATRIAAEGLDFRDGSEILLRDDDNGIASECVRLMRDDQASRTLGESARALMIRQYAAPAVRRSIVRLMSECFTKQEQSHERRSVD